MADNVAEERIDLDDPRYPPELYHHVQDMINQLSTGHQEVSGQFPVPISLCPTLGENSPVYCPICPPPKIEIAFKTLKNRIYYDKRRSPQPLYKTEAAWIQHHWRRVHGNVVIPVPAPSSKVRQTRYMTDWPWQHGDLPWMTGQLPLADEELRDYIYRVVDPSWATIYADLVLGHLHPMPHHTLEDLVDEWRRTDPEFLYRDSLRQGLVLRTLLSIPRVHYD
ncbi:hypothetical protein BDZ89DRAFT_1118124 [Hymenopellis radicata]|nr:hypothetical protein BDZ89DRAFT_1118124 [Hymenopellis radicata]